MKAKQGVIKWLLLAMLFVTNYVNGENVDIQEQETLVFIMQNNYESKPRENNADIYRGTAKLGDRYTLQSRIRGADGKFSSNEIGVSRQGRLKFGKRVDSYVARRNTATRSREVYSHIFRNVTSSLKLEILSGNIERLSIENQQRVMLRKGYMKGTYGANDPLEKKSKQNREINIRRICQTTFTVGKKTERVSEHAKRYTERSDTRQSAVRETKIEKYNGKFHFRSKVALNKNGRIFREDQTDHEVGERNIRFLGSTKQMNFRIAKEERNCDNRMFRRTERTLKKKNVALKQNLDVRKYTTVRYENENPVTSQNSHFSNHTNDINPKFISEKNAKEQGKIQSRMILRETTDNEFGSKKNFESKAIKKKRTRFTSNNLKKRKNINLIDINRDERNDSREKMQKLRSLITDNSKYRSSLSYEIREDKQRSTKTTPENRNLNVKSRKINPKESQTVGRGNLEDKNSKRDRLSKNAEVRDLREHRTSEVRIIKNAVKSSENKRQKSNTLIERTRRFQLDRSNREGVLPKKVMALRLTNTGSHDGRQEVDTEGNIERNSFEDIGLDGTQKNYKISETNLKERSAETKRHEKILEYEGNNKLHGMRSNFRKQNMVEIKLSAKKVRLSENQEEIFESKFTMRTYYREPAKENKNLHSEKRISKTNFIENRNIQSTKNVESRKTVRSVKSRSTETSEMRNIKNIEIHDRRIFGKNDDSRWPPVYNTRQFRRIAKIGSKIFIRSVRNVAERSVNEIKEIISADHGNMILKGKVQILGRHYVNSRRILTIISTNSFSIRQNKIRSAKRNEQISVANRKEGVTIWERYGRGFRGKVRTIEIPNRENTNRLTQRNLESRKTTTKFIQNLEIKNIQNRQIRSIFKEGSTRGLQTKVRGLKMTPAEIKIYQINAESPKINIISDQRVPNSKRCLIKDRRERNLQNRNGRVFRSNLVGIRISIAENYKTPSWTRAESSKIIKNFMRSIERKTIHDRQAKTITEQRNKGLQRSEEYRKIYQILRHKTLNVEKWSRDKSSIFLERNGRGFRGNMDENESRTTETNGKPAEQSVESHTTNKVLIPNIIQSNIQKRKLLLFRRQKNLAFKLRNGRGFGGKIIKEVLALRTSYFNELSQSKISDHEKISYMYKYLSTSNKDLNNLHFSKITASRKFTMISKRLKVYKNSQRTVKDESYSSTNAIQLSKQMITASVPTIENKLTQRMLQAKRNSFISELTTREARMILKPTQKLRKYRRIFSVRSERGFGLTSAVARLAHREIETRRGIPSYSRGSYTDNRHEIRQILNHRARDRSKSLHWKINFSSSHDEDYSLYQKLGRDLPSSPPLSELNLLNAGSSRSVKNYKSSRKISSSFIADEFSKQTRFGSGRSRQLVDSKMQVNVQMQGYSALGLVSMPIVDIFQKDKPISAQVLRTSEVSAGFRWNTSGMNTASFIFNALFGILVLVTVSGDNRLKSQPFKEKLSDLLFLRS